MLSNTFGYTCQPKLVWHRSSFMPSCQVLSALVKSIGFWRNILVICNSTADHLPILQPWFPRDTLNHIIITILGSCHLHVSHSSQGLYMYWQKKTEFKNCWVTQHFQYQNSVFSLLATKFILSFGALKKTEFWVWAKLIWNLKLISKLNEGWWIWKDNLEGYS